MLDLIRNPNTGFHSEASPICFDFVLFQNTTQTSVSARSENTLYDQIGTPSPCKKGIELRQEDKAQISY